MIHAETELVVGPGAIDPQDADKLLGNRMKFLEISYNDLTNNEFNEEFRGKEGALKYRKMLEDDGVSSAWGYIRSAIRSMPYYMQYASEDPVDLEAAAFAADQLGLDGYQANKYPFQRTLRAFELSLLYGRSGLEIGMQLVGDRAVTDKLIPIHPILWEAVEFDAGGGPQRLHVKGRSLGEKGKDFDRKIPIQKLVLFVNDDDGDLVGQSILRAAYIPYRIKREMLRLINKGFERFLLGIPKIKAPPGVMPGQPAWDVARDLATRFSANPRSGLVVPDGWDLEVLVVNSQMPDAIPYVKLMDEKIAHAMGVDVTNLGGDGGSGGYGHSRNLLAMTERVTRTYVDQLLETVNTYLIPKLLVRNYPFLTRYPQLRYEKGGNVEASPMLNALGMMVTSSMKQTPAASANGGGTQASAKKFSDPDDSDALEFAPSGTEPASRAGAGSAGGGASSTGAGDFDAATFQAIADALPERAREMLGFSEDKRRRLLDQYRRSAQTGYRKKETL